MTTEAIPQSDNLSFIARTWQWLRVIDEAVHYDPAENLHQRMDQIERKLAEMSVNHDAEKGNGI